VRVTIKILKTKAHVSLPEYHSTEAAGMDICSFLDKDITIPPLTRAKIPTGLHLEIPSGFEGQVRPRSGLAAKSGITVLNSPGTIDADYRGELAVILINLGEEPFTVKNGDRIAQLVIAPVTHVEIEETRTLSVTERQGGGFGSTGV